MPSKSLLVKALKKATPAQLIRIRALISKEADENAMADLNPFAFRCHQALVAFDKGHYGNENVLRVLNDMDKELGQALK